MPPGRRSRVIAITQKPTKPTNATSDSELGSGTVGVAITATPSRIQKPSAVGAASTTLSKAGPLKLRTPSARGSPGTTTPVVVALPTSDAPLNTVRSKGGAEDVSLGTVVPKAVRKVVCGALKSIVRVRKQKLHCSTSESPVGFRIGKKPTINPLGSPSLLNDALSPSTVLVNGVRPVLTFSKLKKVTVSANKPGVATHTSSAATPPVPPRRRHLRSRSQAFEPPLDSMRLAAL